MISITTYEKPRNLDLASINSDDSILIIGRGNIETKLATFYKPINIDDAVSKFGECELVNGYRLALECGATNIYLLNCYAFSDYITAVDLISHYNFAFVVPIGINMSEKFYLEDENRDVWFAEYYLDSISRYCNSTIIMTDAHYSYYEDMDSYITDMHKKIRDFKNNNETIISKYGRNLSFCLNNIDNVDYSNIYLASSLCNTEVGLYPKNRKEYHSKIYIDNEDIYIDEIIYFKDNFISGLSIENIKNFRLEKDANKILIIDRVVKHLERYMDTSFIIGKSYDPYIKLSLHDYVDNFLRKESGATIKSYRINNIDFYKNGKNSVECIIDFNITPINSLEDIRMSMEA